MYRVSECLPTGHLLMAKETTVTSQEKPGRGTLKQEMKPKPASPAVRQTDLTDGNITSVAFLPKMCSLNPFLREYWTSPKEDPS